MKHLLKYKKSIFGFTLVELIVVITILAILGTIAFVSFGSQSSSARDSNRIADISSLSKSLEIASVKSGSFPDPSGNFAVTYSGAILWKQGTAGDSVIQTAGAGGAKISKKPTDPLNNSEYGYSKTMTTREYSLRANYEGRSLAYTRESSPSSTGADGVKRPGVPFVIVYADDGSPQIVYVDGNYNGLVIKTQTGASNALYYYLIATPSILSSTGSSGQTIELSSLNLLSGSLLVNGGSLSGTLFQPDITKAVAYVALSLPSSVTESANFASGIANAYSGTSFASLPAISPYITALASNNTQTLASLGASLVSVSLGGGKVTISSGGSTGGSTCTPSAYSGATTYTAGQCFSYNGATITVTGTGIGSASTKADAGCNTNDIAVWQGGTTNVQIWSACNVGATIAGTGTATQTCTDSECNSATFAANYSDSLANFGGYFQWGNNGNIINATYQTSGWLACTGTTDDSTYSQSANFYRYKDFDTYNWCAGTANSNLWGNTTNTSLARKGPCPVGYHVPTGGSTNTSTEWGTLYTIGIANTVIGSCNQSNVYDRLQCALLFPFSGYRNGFSGGFSNQGRAGYYWSSTMSYSTTFFPPSSNTVQGSAYKVNGYSVRCLRN